ncbi:MAG: PRC-barrel domain-containing protein [Pseudomonadota bacterium]
MFRKTLLASTALIATAGAAAASCDDGLTAMGGNDTLSAAILDASPEARRDLRNFAYTADQLRMAGYDEACEAVVEAIKDMADRRSVASEASALETQTQGETDDWSWTGPDMAELAASAQPFDGRQMAYASNELVNADVRMMDGDDIGAVDGFLTGEEGISHVIVGYGGFLNIGDREVAVPVEKLRFDRENRVFFVEGQESWFENQPDWDEADWAEGVWKRDAS